jgi:hypothetical protein
MFDNSIVERVDLFLTGHIYSFNFEVTLQLTLTKVVEDRGHILSKIYLYKNDWLLLSSYQFFGGLFGNILILGVRRYRV